MHDDAVFDDLADLDDSMLRLHRKFIFEKLEWRGLDKFFL